MYCLYQSKKTLFKELAIQCNSIAIMLSMSIATVYPCILSTANRGFVSFTNFQGPGDKPLSKTAN